MWKNHNDFRKFLYVFFQISLCHINTCYLKSNLQNLIDILKLTSRDFFSDFQIGSDNF